MHLVLLFVWGCDNLIEIESDKPSAATIPLRRYWNGETTDYLTIAQPIDELGDSAQGSISQEIEGYIFPVQQPGTVPLRLFWRAEWQDFFTTTVNPGFGYVHIERIGYLHL